MTGEKMVVVCIPSKCSIMYLLIGCVVLSPLPFFTPTLFLFPKSLSCPPPHPLPQPPHPAPPPSLAPLPAPLPQLTVVAEREVRGAVYEVLPFQGGRLLCSCNNRVMLHRCVCGGGEAGKEG